MYMQLLPVGVTVLFGVPSKAFGSRGGCVPPPNVAAPDPSMIQVSRGNRMSRGFAEVIASPIRQLIHKALKRIAQGSTAHYKSSAQVR